jgi:muramoyltetrapeptide carboxypeptidase
MRNPIKPRPLLPGDTIGVYSPSSGVEFPLKESYERGKQMLLKRGYKVKEAPHVFEWKAHYSADGPVKAADLLALVRDPEVKAILPTLGGTTAYQMLPHLPLDEIRRNPKLIFGFSDNSQPACVIADRTGLVTFHGHSDVVFGLGDLDDPEKLKQFATGGHYTQEMFFDALEGRIAPGPVRKATPWRALRKGSAEGWLLGGNIQTLDLLRGTPYALDWDGALFFWEVTADVQLHQLDMLLAGLALSGVLARIKGMVVGKGDRLTEQFYALKHEDFDEMILRHCAPYRFPILASADIGHDMECCMLPISASARIEGDSLILLESPYGGGNDERP